LCRQHHRMYDAKAFDIVAVDAIGAEGELLVKRFYREDYDTI